MSEAATRNRGYLGSFGPAGLKKVRPCFRGTQGMNNLGLETP
ncbi:MAG: hypothetical protein DIJKHBIC_02069 [Thermoanaerobaculia bacterium]|nr:hypothetical protein [Thermoanaerobaculia bacterium]